MRQLKDSGSALIADRHGHNVQIRQPVEPFVQLKDLDVVGMRLSGIDLRPLPGERNAEGADMRPEVYHDIARFEEP